MPFTLEKPVAPFPTVEWTPVHHNGIEPRPTSLLSTPTRNTGLSVSYTNYLTPPQTHPAPIWNCIPTCLPIPTHPRSQHPLNPPNSTIAPAALNSFDSVSYLLLLRKVTVIWLKVYIFISFHLYMSQRRSPAGRTTLSSVLGKCRSDTPSIFVCFLPFQVVPYYVT